MIYTDETGTNNYEDFLLFHNDDLIRYGRGLEANRLSLHKPKAGDHLYIHTSLTIEHRIELSNYEFMAPFRKAMEEASAMIEEFTMSRIQYLKPVEIVIEPNKNTYQIEINYKK